MPKTFIFDGKSANLLWDESSTAWQYFTNAPEGNKPNYYGCIPTIYRAVQMIANDVSKMPFVIKRGDEVIDNSQDYMNTLGFLPNPRKLFATMSMSIDLTGSAYGLKVTNPARYVSQIKYCAASTITPEFNKQTGALEKFTRKINESQGKDYKPEEMLYWWLSDPMVEIGPPRSWPLKVALAAGGVLHSMDTFVIGYFERGMVRPTIISVEGNPPEAERERIEKWFDTFMSGVRNAFRQKVFKAGSISAQQIGDGLDQLENMELTAEKRQDIAHAFGIPYALLFSEAANNATLTGDTINYYRITVEPRCEDLASVLREQLFTPKSRYDGYSLEFMPESLDVYQTDENERAESLVKYVNVGFPLLMACDVLGVDLTAEQRAEIEKIETEKKVRADELTANLTKKPAPDKEQPSPDQEEPDMDELQRKSNAGINDELGKWRRKALKALRAGKSAAVEFESDIIPMAIRGAIFGALEGAQSETDLLHIFASALKWRGYP